MEVKKNEEPCRQLSTAAASVCGIENETRKVAETSFHVQFCCASVQPPTNRITFVLVLLEAVENEESTYKGKGDWQQREGGQAAGEGQESNGSREKQRWKTDRGAEEQDETGCCGKTTPQDHCCST